jgi:hypothetical protein
MLNAIISVRFLRPDSIALIRTIARTDHGDPSAVRRLRLRTTRDAQTSFAVSGKVASRADPAVDAQVVEVAAAPVVNTARVPLVTGKQFARSDE